MKISVKFSATDTDSQMTKKKSKLQLQAEYLLLQD